MSEWILTEDGVLIHHGVEGQKWGDRNGPPYPLDSSQASAAEKKKGWEESGFASKKEYRRAKNKEYRSNYLKSPSARLNEIKKMEAEYTRKTNQQQKKQNIEFAKDSVKKSKELLEDHSKIKEDLEKNGINSKYLRNFYENPKADDKAEDYYAPFFKFSNKEKENLLKYALNETNDSIKRVTEMLKEDEEELEKLTHYDQTEWILTEDGVLMHYGIEGQKWGHRNGPPYPLDSSQASAAEKKAGFRSKASISRKEAFSKSKSLSDEELKKNVERLRTEREYRQLRKDERRDEKSYVTTFLEKHGDAALTAVAASTIAIGVAYYKKFGLQWLNKVG